MPAVQFKGNNTFQCCCKRDVDLAFAFGMHVFESSPAKLRCIVVYKVAGRYWHCRWLSIRHSPEIACILDVSGSLPCTSFDAPQGPVKYAGQWLQRRSAHTASLLESLFSGAPGRLHVCLQVKVCSRGLSLVHAK